MTTTKTNSKKFPLISRKPRKPPVRTSDTLEAVTKYLECDDDRSRFEANRSDLTKTRSKGVWKIEYVKRGHGFKAVFTPESYGPSAEGPTFPTEGDVQKWINTKFNAD
jgi:hypothetical protein